MLKKLVIPVIALMGVLSFVPLKANAEEFRGYVDGRVCAPAVVARSRVIEYRHHPLPRRDFHRDWDRR